MTDDKPTPQPSLIDVLVRIAEALEERNYMEWMRLEEDGIVVAADMPEPGKGDGDLPS